jgi:hypothetical protein
LLSETAQELIPSIEAERERGVAVEEVISSADMAGETNDATVL